MDEQNKKEGDLTLADKLYKKRTIVIAEEISKASYAAFLKEIIAMDSESSDPITVYVNSPGGDAYSGLAFFDVIKYVNSPVTIIGTGLVASAAALLYLAVPRERRLSLPNTRYLIHQPLLQASEDSPYMTSIQIDIEAEEMVNLRNRFDSLIAEATGMSLDEAREATERDNWLDADEAVKLGIVGRIIKSASER